MREFLTDIPLFVEVAQRKSFSQAAEALGLGASTISRRIRLLEEKMGALLFYRDTRNVELTSSGAYLLERCQYILNESKATYEAVVQNMREPSGLIRVSIYADIARNYLKAALSAFAKKWPKIQIQMLYLEKPVDLRFEPFDVAFLDDVAIAAPLVARKIMTIEGFIYASPELLERCPKLELAEPYDLCKLPCIVLDRYGPNWILTDGRQSVCLEIKPQYTFSSVELCLNFAVDGHGIALLRKQFASPYEKKGRLVRLLPNWATKKHKLNLVTGPGQLPARVKLFLDHVREHFAHLEAHQ